MRDIDEMAGRTSKVSNQIEHSEEDIQNKHIMSNTRKQMFSGDAKKVDFADSPHSDDEIKPEIIPLPKIIVRDPVTHDTWEHGKYTTFQICLRTDHPAFHLHVSTVRRRFSELIWLDNLLKSKNQGANLLPPPPPRRIFSDRFTPGFLKSRAKEMQKYLNKLLEVDQILSDNAFHLFIQTDLSTCELTDYFNGKLPENIIAEAWANMGHVHSNSLLRYMAIQKHAKKRLLSLLGKRGHKPLPEEPQEIVMNEDDLLSSSDDSACAAPAHSSQPTTTTTNKNKDVEDFDKASINTTSSCNSMADMGRLGLPARAEVEMEPTVVVGEPAWQSQSVGS